MLDLAFDEAARFYEAPAHLKASGGIFVIDDFGPARSIAAASNCRERRPAWWSSAAASIGAGCAEIYAGAGASSFRRADANLAALMGLPGAWMDQVHGRTPLEAIILDMDSPESPTHGEQEGLAYNGHFGCTCYLPLFVANRFGDLERCLLGAGHVPRIGAWCWNR